MSIGVLGGGLLRKSAPPPQQMHKASGGRPVPGLQGGVRVAQLVGQLLQPDVVEPVQVVGLAVLIESGGDDRCLRSGQGQAYVGYMAHPLAGLRCALRRGR